MSGRRARSTPALRARVDSGLAELVGDRDRARGWTLLLDGTPQSHVDLDDPTHLEFEYVRRLAHVVDTTLAPRRPMRVLHLGGGALTLARYVAATRPRSDQHVAEVDGALVELVRRELPLDRTWRVKIRVADARASLARAPAGRFDLVIADVFAEGRTPAHLTSVEFVQAVADTLAPGGRYAANIADGDGLAFARSQVATAQAVFPHLCLIGDPPVLRGRRFGNLVLVGGRAPLPVAELATLAARGPGAGRVEHGRDLERFTGGARPVTDATAVGSPAPPPDLFGPG
ncbi:fused MFS/spermidine synthase [Pseudonocardia aurantiaca]|uniref:Spermidine synthase n=1 Tax=Pseudonocardia aurantiaca TaxID=75290 RepID=A0ABW4FM54_9PSEU